MTKRQSSYVYAAKNVLNVLMQNVAIYAFISVLVALRDRIQGRLDLIETIAQEQERSRRGIGMDKTRIRGLLTNTLVVVCGQMRSWANQTNQNDLAEQAPASRSHWARVSHLKLGEKANVILKLARTHLDKLTGYGMTPELLNELESRIATYNAIALAPRHAITHRKTLTGLLAGELDGLRNDLENVLAPLMNQFEEIAPAFFQDYKNARLLVTPATTPIEVIRERAATKAKKVADRRQARQDKAKAKADEKAQIRAERQAKLESIRINLGTSTSTATLTPTITITPVPRDGEETPAEPNPAATASGLSG